MVLIRHVCYHHDQTGKLLGYASIIKVLNEIGSKDICVCIVLVETSGRVKPNYPACLHVSATHGLIAKTQPDAKSIVNSFK